MSASDFTLFSIPVHISRNKSQEWKDMTIRTYTSLCRFMKNNELIVGIEPFDSDGKLKLDTVIKVSNVTEEGLEFYKKVVLKWYEYLDRSTKSDKYENISRLEKGLAKIREGK